MPNVKCILCEKFKDSSKCRFVSSTAYKWFHEHFQGKDIMFSEDDLRLCSSCTRQPYNLKASIDSSATLPDLSSIDNVGTNDDGLTLENVIYAGSGQKKCIICRQNRNSSSNMMTMPKSSRLDLLVLHRIYAPQNVRCCQQHILKNDRLNPNEFIEMDDRQKLKTTLQPQELISVLDDLLRLLEEAIKSPRFDFHDSVLTDDDYPLWTSWNIAEFDTMFKTVSPFLRSSRNREARNALAIFWAKAKTNLSFSQTRTLFNYPGDSEARRKRVADTFDPIRILLVHNLVPLNLGVCHLTRNQALMHNTVFSKEFWDNKVTIIWNCKFLKKVCLENTAIS